MRRTALCLSLAAAISTSRVSAEVAAPPAPATAAETLTADAAWSRILGNTVSGTNPDGTYIEYFLPDGRFRVADGDGKAEGHWTLKDGRLCTEVDDEGEECQAIEVRGTAGAFVDQVGSRYPFTILPGNPKGL